MDIFDMNDYMPTTSHYEPYDELSGVIESSEIGGNEVSYGSSAVSYGAQIEVQSYQQQFYQQPVSQQPEQPLKEEVKAEPEVIPIIDHEAEAKAELDKQLESSKPEVTISNVVCNYRCRSHLNLREIALNTKHVIYKRDQGKVMMKIRKPNMMANIWSSGKIVCQGARSEQEAMIGARRFARILYKTGNENVRVSNYKVVNVLGNCKLPFAVDIMQFSSENAGPHCSYEPELHPAVTFRPKNNTTVKIFSTGALTLLGRNVALVKEALDLVYPLLFKHRKTRSELDVDLEEEEDEDEF